MAQNQTEAAVAEQNLTAEEMKQFLLTAEIVSSEKTDKGITQPYRLTLCDGKLTHDAGFQSIDQRSHEMTLANGTKELNFRDHTISTSRHMNWPSFLAWNICCLLRWNANGAVTQDR